MAEIDLIKKSFNELNESERRQVAQLNFGTSKGSMRGAYLYLKNKFADFRVIFLIKKGDYVLGWSMLDLYNHFYVLENERCLMMWVRPSERRHGYGKLLLEFASNHLKYDGYKFYTMAHDKDSVAFFEATKDVSQARKLNKQIAIPIQNHSAKYCFQNECDSISKIE